MPQNLQTIMLQITEINQSPACLLDPVAFSEFDDRLSQLPHQRSRLMQFTQKGFSRTSKKRLLQLQQAFLHMITQFLNSLLKPRVG
ncbi:hypothetical protein D3C85_1663050 [compost metagenome]